MRLDKIWNLRQATRMGLPAGLAALFLWPLHAAFGATVRPAFTAALAVAAFCGASILAFTILDLLTVARDPRVLPARIFDLALGASLALPSAAALSALLA